MLKRLVIASNNSHKTAEMVDYLAVLGVEAINYRDLHEQIAFPDETTDDMAQNARVKAQTIHEILPDDADRTAYLQADFVVISPTGKTYFSQARGGITLATEPRGSR